MPEFDDHMALPLKIDWPKCDLHDFSKLRLEEGRIHYRLYRQDGSMQDMACADTPDNRVCVSWMQVHDRWGARPQGGVNMSDRPGAVDP